MTYYVVPKSVKDFKMIGIILFHLLFASVLAEFDLQIIGETLSAEEAAKRELCTSKYCVSDGELLFYAATQNESVDPCLDFKEFAMGTFIELRATNDRYREIGLISDTKQNHDERKRKLIAQEINAEKDSRMVKVVKNFFGKCVNSRIVENNGLNDMLNHLKSLGGSPYLDGEAWDPSKFSVTNIFKKEPAFALHILLSYKFESYKSPLSTESPLSYDGMKKTDLWGSAYSSESYTDYIEMLEDVNNLYLLDTDNKEKVKSQIRKSVDRAISFRDDMVVQEDFAEEYEHTSIKTLMEFFDAASIDFLQLINTHKFENTKLTDRDHIYVQGLEGLKWRLDALQKIEKGIIADAFAINYMYMHRFLFVVYPFYSKDKVGFNTRPPQRWEQCLKFVQTNMAPVLESMLASTQLNTEKIEKFVRDVIHDYLEKIIPLSEGKDLENNFLDNLKSNNFSVDMFDYKFTDQSLDEYYDELQLKGSEGLLESARAIEGFHSKIESDAKKNDLEINASNEEIVYRPYMNHSLRLPVVWTYYPWFHSDRPKFFNQATLFLDIVAAMKFSINYYFEDFIKIDDFDFAFENYQNWFANGGNELLIGANRLTPSQLFWLSLARSRYYKGKYGESGYGKTDFFYSNGHRTLDTYDGFREVYNCNKI